MENKRLHLNSETSEMSMISAASQLQCISELVLLFKPQVSKVKQLFKCMFSFLNKYLVLIE